MDILMFAGLTALAVFGVLLKLDIRKIVGYEVAADIILTVGLAMLYAGTYTGTMIAVLAGLLISMVLRIVKYLFGYKVFDKKTRSWVYHAR